MNRDEARSLASGYAWGVEDTAGTVTQTPAGEPYPRGDWLFAQAYAGAWGDYNDGKRASGPQPVRYAYQRWQETGGRTIESETDERLAAARASLRAQDISYGELAELESLAPYIEPGDTELLEAAGVPEFGTSADEMAAEAERYFIVVVRDTDGSLAGLSRRYPGPDGEPFTGPWGAMTEDEAADLAAAWNADPREGSTAEVVELYRFAGDPVWTEA